MSLPAGTYFRFKYKGGYDFGFVAENPTGSYFLIEESRIPYGSVVHKAVWKPGDNLESRGTYINKKKESVSNG